MVEAVRSSGTPHPPQRNDQAATVELKKSIDLVTADLYQLTNNPFLSADPQFIGQIHQHLASLKTAIQQSAGSETAKILSAIINHQMEIPDFPTQLSVLNAIVNYKPDDPVHSDLSRILHTFVKYPEPTQTLIQELEILSNTKYTQPT